jgi:hypothetical protein
MPAQFVNNMVVDPRHLIGRHHAPGDPRLIGDNEKQEMFLQFLQGSNRIRIEYDFRRMTEMATILDNRAIPVQKNRWFQS